MRSLGGKDEQLYWTIDNELSWLDWMIEEYCLLLKTYAYKSSKDKILHWSNRLEHYRNLRAKLHPKVVKWRIYLKTGIYYE